MIKLICLIFVLFLNYPCLAVNWVSLDNNDNWSIDADSIKWESIDNQVISAWLKVNVADRNEIIDGKKVEYTYYFEHFIPKLNQALTITRVDYDKDKHGIQNISMPYGEEPMDFPPDSVYGQLCNALAAYTPQLLEDTKQALKIGIIRSFGIPVIVENTKLYYNTPTVDKVTQNTIPRPSFKEFCPEVYYHKEYMDANWVEEKKFSTGQKALLWVPWVGIFSMVPTYSLAISDTKWRRKQRSQKIIANYNHALDYWKGREKSFNESLELCKAVSDVATCYIQVKHNEYQKSLLIEQNKLLRGIGMGVVLMNQNLNNIKYKLQY